MNHAQKTDRINELENQCTFSQNLINDFFRTLHSTKYHCGDELDNYICIDDVFNRLMDIRTALTV